MIFVRWEVHKAMKKDIHPAYVPCQVSCACGNRFETMATVSELKVGVCSACHPFFTGKKGRILSEAGRLEKFNKKYAGMNYGQKETSSD